MKRSPHSIDNFWQTWSLRLYETDPSPQLQQATKQHPRGRDVIVIILFVRTHDRRGVRQWQAKLQKQRQKLEQRTVAEQELQQRKAEAVIVGLIGVVGVT